MSVGHGAWKCPKKSPTDPPGLFGHTLTAVGQYGIYLFGGQGKKPSDAVYSLDPDTVTWALVDTKGVRTHANITYCYARRIVCSS